MALFKRASIYYVMLTAPDGTPIRRSTGTTDRKKAEEYHDDLKAQFWDLARLNIKPKRTWDEAAFAVAGNLNPWWVVTRARR